VEEKKKKEVDKVCVKEGRRKMGGVEEGGGQGVCV